MFLRTVRAPGGAGRSYEYLRLVEAYRDGGKTKHRTIVNLGRKDLLAPHLDGLVRALGGAAAAPGVSSAAVVALSACDWGATLVARTLWAELGLDETLCRLGGPELSDRALVLVVNRLSAPTSEHGLAGWLETAFVCDRAGRRFVPEWRDDAERLASPSPRVRVTSRQLKRWYRTLDRLFAGKDEIERALYLKLRDLFSLEVDMALYDVTSTYFEGRGPDRLGAHGYSRDGRPRDPQVLVGLVLVGGWPIAHHVFAGNVPDAKTLPEVLDDLERRFGLNRVVLVGDRGMVTSDNLVLLRRRGQGYIVGRNRRRNAEIPTYIARATGEWIDCPLSIGASEKSDPPRTRVQEVAGDEPGVRIFVVHSEERAGYEARQRTAAMARVKRELEALAQRIATGRLKAPEKVGAAAGRTLARHHGQRYYDWTYQDGRFRFFEHPVNLPREIAIEGKYIIQTEEQGLSPVEAVAIYKQLSRVEAAFADLKDVIEMRPIYHRTDDRVQAHIFVAALAFLLHQALEKKLTAAGLNLSARAAFDALRTVRLVDIDLGAGQTKCSVTKGSARATQVLRALNITDLNPPTPPKSGQTIM